MILDSVTTGGGVVNNLFTLTVKGDCVFQHQVKFLGKTQLQAARSNVESMQNLVRRPWLCWRTDMPLQTLIATKF